jgi:hypothetical protein
LAAAEKALGVRQEVGLTYWALKTAIVEALEASFALGDVDKIRGHLATLDALQPGVLTPFLRAQQARFQARLASERDSQAEAEFITAQDLFRTLGTPFYLAVTMLEHAEALVDLGHQQEAELLLAEARETFERLEAKPWLERTAQASPTAAARPEAVAERS